MPVSSLILAHLAGHQAHPIDAHIVYNDLQQKLLDAPGFSYYFDSGPDAWDVTIHTHYEKPGRFSRYYMEYDLRCDGKWFVFWNGSQVIHRPARPSDINHIYIVGFESIFSDYPPLEVSGPLQPSISTKGDISKDFAYISYRITQDIDRYVSKFHRDKHQTGRLYVDPDTGYPHNLKFKSPDSPPLVKDVPLPQPQQQVLDKCSKTRRAVKSLIIYRTTNFRGGKNPVQEIIYLPNNKEAHVIPKHNSDLRKNADGTYTWLSKSPATPVAKVALRGFESFTNAKVQSVTGTSFLSSSLAHSSSNFAWETHPSPPAPGTSVIMRYNEDTFLPDCYFYK